MLFLTEIQMIFKKIFNFYQFVIIFTFFVLL